MRLLNFISGIFLVLIITIKIYLYLNLQNFIKKSWCIYESLFTWKFMDLSNISGVQLLRNKYEIKQKHLKLNDYL